MVTKNKWYDKWHSQSTASKLCQRAQRTQFSKEDGDREAKGI